MVTINKNYKILSNEGFVLPSILVISMVITSILTLYILLFLASSRVEAKFINKKKLKLNCETVLTEYITGIINSTSKDSSSGVKTIIKKDQFGLYERIAITSYSKNDSVRCEYIIGFEPEGYFKNALTWSSPDLRGRYSGDTKIIGGISATSEDINRSKIFGINSNNQEFFSESVTRIDSIPVKIFHDSLITGQFYRPRYFEQFDTVINSNLLLNSNKQHLLQYPKLNVKGNLVIDGNFNKYNDCKIIVEGAVTFEEGTNLNGLLQIYAHDNIVINKNCELRDLQISSFGTIDIKGNCILGGVQLFSKKNILIKSSNILFPSIICGYVDVSDSTNRDNSLRISDSIVNGSILLLCSEIGYEDNQAMIELIDNSKLQGMCYSENLIYSDFDIIGSVYAYKFYFLKQPTSYRNLLVNSKIDRDKLDDNFCLPSGIRNIKKKKVIDERWIF